MSTVVFQNQDLGPAEGALKIVDVLQTNIKKIFKCHKVHKIFCKAIHKDFIDKFY